MPVLWEVPPLHLFWITLTQMVRWVRLLSACVCLWVLALSLLCLSLLLRLSISPCAPRCLSAATNAQLREAVDRTAQSSVCGPCTCSCVCLSLGERVCVHPSTRTAMSLGCVIEMEMSQSATAVVFHLTLHSLHCSSAAKLTHSVCDSVCMAECLCVYVCVRWHYLAPQFLTWGPGETVWKCNQLVITIISVSLINTQMRPGSVSSWFPWLCVVTQSSLGQLWDNKDM